MIRKSLLSYVLAALVAFLSVGCKESPADPQSAAKPDSTRQDTTRQDTAARFDKNWSTPQRISLELQVNHQPMAPSLALAGGKLWMTFVGRDTMSAIPGLPKKLSRDVYLTSQEGSAWARPLRLSSDKRATVALPLFACDRADAAHVVWGERWEATYENFHPLPDHIFYANVKGGVVSPAETLHAITSPGKFDALFSPWQPVIDAEQNIYVPYDIPSSKINMGYNAFAKRPANGAWKKDLAVTRNGTNTRFALTQEGYVLCAFIDADTTVAADANSVFFTRSNDGGETWSNRVLVSRSGNKRASYPLIFSSPTGELHIVWMKDLGNGYGWGEAIWHSVSKDEGQTWSQPISALPPTPKGLPRLDVCAAAIDRAGRIHLAFQYCGLGVGSPYRPYYLRYEGGLWREPEHLFGLTLAGQELGMAIDEQSKTIHVVFQTSELGAPWSFYHTTRKLE